MVADGRWLMKNIKYNVWVFFVGRSKTPWQIKQFDF